MSLTWLSSKPVNPTIGDTYFDTTNGIAHIWEGNTWAVLSGGFGEPEPKFYAPTEEQLEKYPALKQAWEEYMVIRKLLGL
jgi:hypothetical protein